MSVGGETTRVMDNQRGNEAKGGEGGMIRREVRLQVRGFDVDVDVDGGWTTTKVLPKSPRTRTSKDSPFDIPRMHPGPGLGTKDC